MRIADAERLCRELMAEHGLSHWNFTWINSGRCFGQCNYATRSIILSIPLVESNGIDQVKDTILHEIAHALAGLKAKHGPLWIMVAKRIGCTGTRCFTWDEVSRPAFPTDKGYRGECECGRHAHHRNRAPLHYPYFCKKCHKRITFIKQ